MPNNARLKKIQDCLNTAFAPVHLQIEDQSALHAGHAGARDGRGHFAVLIVAETFTDKLPLQRHRLIYQALGEAMQTDIHALSIQALTPAEYRVNPETVHE